MIIAPLRFLPILYHVIMENAMGTGEKAHAYYLPCYMTILPQDCTNRIHTLREKNERGARAGDTAKRRLGALSYPGFSLACWVLEAKSQRRTNRGIGVQESGGSGAKT